MKSSTPSSETSTDTAVLGDWLQQLVTEQFGAKIFVTEVSRQLLRTASWYQADRVDCQLSDGQCLRLFLKDFGAFRYDKGQMAERRERERWVYHQLLDGRKLGTARYWGSRWEPGKNCYWLALEFVEGAPLDGNDPAECLATAIWLARMQARCRPGEPDRTSASCLQRHDAAFFHKLFQWDLSAIAWREPELAARLAPLSEMPERLAEMTRQQPPVLVHGDLKLVHVLIDRRADPWRVCPIDWEKAGLGSPLYDLAALNVWLESPLAERVFARYYQETACQGLNLGSMEEARRALDWLQLCHLACRAGRAIRQGRNEAKIRRLCGATGALWNKLRTT